MLIRGSLALEISTLYDFCAIYVLRRLTSCMRDIQPRPTYECIFPLLGYCTKDVRKVKANDKVPLKKVSTLHYANIYGDRGRRESEVGRWYDPC